MNLFKKHFDSFFSKGYKIIPSVYGDTKPVKGLTGWTSLDFTQPDTIRKIKDLADDAGNTNICLLTGEPSGVIGLDVDTNNPEYLEIIRGICPESPCEKFGSKGFTRFFRYMDEGNTPVKFNGELIVEILSTGKKTTLPPSLHKNGNEYVWIGKPLNEINKEDLPLLPPFLLSNIESILKSKYPDLSGSIQKNDLKEGRTVSLTSLCGTLIANKTPLDEIVRTLVEEDKKHEVPLFSDPSHNYHLESYSNALKMVSDIYTTMNNKFNKTNKEYESPLLISNKVSVEIEVGKSLRGELEKQSLPALPSAQGVLKDIIENILENSFIKQDEFAFSAALAMMAVSCSRKFTFQGLSPNLYILNVAPSGSGKDQPQQKLKEYLIELKHDYLLGAGDYVSDASLMDSLPIKPVRLDIMDEAGGILKSITSGRSEYNGKMADILAELYTCSANKYLGRALASGVKGECYRPNVNILASTTPTGLSEAISPQAIEKGLLGRFLVFFGDSNKEGKRPKQFTKLSGEAESQLQFLLTYKPEENSDVQIAGIEQKVTDLKATAEAEAKLDELFALFDKMRRSSNTTDLRLPIICRLYQQMVKIAMLHALSRSRFTVPDIELQDIEFAKKTVDYYFRNFEIMIEEYLHEGKNDKILLKVLSYLPKNGDVISKAELISKTKWLKKFERDQIIQDLIEAEKIFLDRRVIGNNSKIIIGRL